MGVGALRLRAFAGGSFRRLTSAGRDALPAVVTAVALPAPPPPPLLPPSPPPCTDEPSTSSTSSPAWEAAGPSTSVGFDDALEHLLHHDAHDEGGLGLTDKRLLENQRAAILEMLKDMGRQLLMGNLNLLSMSMPVRMFEPRSYLQKIADPWVYPALLSAAADPACPPALRLSHVATWFVAGLQHVYQSWRKPFNPVLGETWAARLPDGSAVFVEQVAHHPPVSAFELVGPGGAYAFSGTSQPDVSYKGADVKTCAKGTRRLSFACDAGSGRGPIKISYPHFWMRGVIGSGAPRGEMVGVATLSYEGTGLACELRFGRSAEPGHRGDPLLQRGDTVTGCVFRAGGGGGGGGDAADDDADDSGSPGGASSSGRGGGGGGLGGAARKASSRPSLASFASALNLSASTASGGGQPGPPREVVATCAGNWLSHLDWDGVRAWTLASDAPAEWVPVAGGGRLPSDAAAREDLSLLAAATPADGSFAFDPVAIAASQRAKEAMEVAQRADAKARKEGRAAAGLA